MLHVLGIRHHGPGSAKNVKAFLEELKPDIVLIEGPPEADSILQWADDAALKPPVAILVYQPDDPKESAFYPFAEFSPEWQAMQYAMQKKVPVRFMDLPIAHQIAVAAREKEETKEAAAKQENKEQGTQPELEEKKTSRLEIIDETVISPERGEIAAPDFSILPHHPDPISYLAEAAGYTDSEKWWEQMFEHRLDNEQVFDAVAEAMTALRETLPRKDEKIEELREAWMRKTIRQAEKEMYTTIAVVCGAWHAPALQNIKSYKSDNELLKGLPKVKTECTWIPWTYSRLSFYSGYGAGIQSPGWYGHVWHYPLDDGTRWMAKVARLFREKQMDTSVAHVMEAVRLANALASLRGMHKAGLEELNEAALSILCNGESILLQLIHDELIVSNTIGEVPDGIPKPPLQSDIEKGQKKLRLPATAEWKDYTLDLRKDTDLERSIFLHRLQLLGIRWGERSSVSGKGTFKEQWRLQWQPELMVHIIEKGSWGNTVEEAADQFVADKASHSSHLKEVCTLLENALPAELPRSVEKLIQQIDNLAATGSDVVQLMEVVPGLVSVSRYGNVRQTDAGLVLGIVQSMMVRIFASLPSACIGIDEAASENLLELFFTLNDAINILQDDSITQQWQQTIAIIANSKNTSPIIAGYCTRLLSDRKILAGDELVNAFGLSMNTATAPNISAAWLEGFLKGSGTILLLDNELWNTVNNWVAGLNEDIFMQLLPLLRRTFSHYSGPERKKLGEKVKGGNSVRSLQPMETNFNTERAKKGLPVVMELLGYT